MATSLSTENTMVSPFLGTSSETTPLSSLFADPAFLQWSENDLQHIALSERTWESQTKRHELIRGGLTQEHLKLISSRQWKSVLSWAAFDPDEVAVFVDRQGQTALHHACLFRAPASVVEALLYAAPVLASTANDDGELALHWAVRLGASKEVLNLLLNTYPKSVFVSDSTGQTPLSLLFDRYRASLEVAFLHGGSEQVMSTPSWKQLISFVRVYCCDTKYAPDGVQFRPLHAVAACPCGLSVFRFILKVRKDAVREFDDLGRLPLSIVASSPLTNDSIGKIKIEEILACYPESARISDARGRLPLSLAIESGKTWEGGLKMLFDAEPRAISSRDCLTRLYPFMLAGSNNGASDTDRKNDLNTIFCLLREDPSLATPFQSY